MAAKKNSRKNGKNGNVSTGALAAIYTLALIVAAIALLAFSSLLLLPGMMGDPRGPGGFENNAFISALEGNLLLRLALSGLNVLLSIYLLFTYVKDYLRLRASFTLGIIAFLFSFLLYALSSFPLVRVTMGPYGIASSLSFVPMLFSAIGLLIFAKLSNE